MLFGTLTHAHKSSMLCVFIFCIVKEGSTSKCEVFYYNKQYALGARERFWELSSVARGRLNIRRGEKWSFCFHILEKAIDNTPFRNVLDSKYECLKSINTLWQNAKESILNVRKLFINIFIALYETKKVLWWVI